MGNVTLLAAVLKMNCDDENFLFFNLWWTAKTLRQKKCPYPLKIPQGNSMSQLVEFLPVLVFFLVYQWTDMVTATMALMASMSLFCLMEWMIRRKLTRARLLALVLVLLFGSATVLTRNALFIQWKPTILQWILAVVFLGSHVVGGGKVLIRRLMENNVTLPDPIWIRLNLAWVGFFLLSGALNLFVAWSFSEEIWVRFKLFGLMGLTIIFALLQGAYMIRHVQENKPGE